MLRIFRPCARRLSTFIDKRSPSTFLSMYHEPNGRIEIKTHNQLVSATKPVQTVMFTVSVPQNDSTTFVDKTHRITYEMLRKKKCNCTYSYKNQLFLCDHIPRGELTKQVVSEVLGVTNPLKHIYHSELILKPVCDND